MSAAPDLNPYAEGSVEGAAYRAALALGRELLDREDDGPDGAPDPSVAFPPDHVAAFFEAAGFGLDQAREWGERFRRRIATASTSYLDEREAEGLPLVVTDAAKSPDEPRRAKIITGVGALALQGRMKSAARAAGQLADFMRELHLDGQRPGQAHTARGQAIRRLYEDLARALLDGVLPREAIDRDALIDRALPSIAITDTGYGRVQNRIGYGLDAFAEAMRQRADDEAFWQGLGDASGKPKGARHRFVAALGAIWHDATNSRPTFGDGYYERSGTGSKRSPFERLGAAILGHLAGLIVAERGEGVDVLALLGLLDLKPVRGSDWWKEAYAGESASSTRA